MENVRRLENIQLPKLLKTGLVMEPVIVLAVLVAIGLLLLLLAKQQQQFYAPLRGRMPRNKWERMYGIPVLNREQQRTEGAVNMYGGWMDLSELPEDYPIKRAKRFARDVGDRILYPPLEQFSTSMADRCDKCSKVE